MADDHRNKPKKPQIIDLAPSEYGKGLEQRKRFWDVGKKTTRGRIFWMDIETTGLGKQVTEFGPERWNEIVAKMDAQTGLANKLKVFKQFDEYKYFEQVGLAQLVTHSRSGPKAGQGGMPPWPHGAGYTVWEDNFANTLLSKKYEVSHFSRSRGIISRSLEAALEGKAGTEVSRLSEFSQHLINNTKWGRTSSIRGWNVWFDVFATQAFMARHGGSLDAAGIDPFHMMSATKRGNLRVESMEEHYFDMLNWKGWQNPDWARKHLRFGRMYAAKVGAKPGDPIPIYDHFARKAQGKGSLLRGRFGWKAELLEGIFNQYGSVESSLKGWKFPGGRHLSDLDTHDAMRDIASEYELSRRFVHTKKAMAHYDARWNTLKASFPGRSQGDIVGALSFARAGFLGKDFQARGMRGSGFVRHMANPGMTEEMLRRAGTIWGAIEAQTPTTYKPGGPAKTIKSPYGDYLRLLWKRDIQSEVAQGVREQVRADVGRKLTQASNRWKSWGVGKKGLALGAAAFVLYNAFGRQQHTIDSNVSSNYLPGQMGSKVIDVPWSSPWEGIATDDRSAVDMIAKAGLGAGGAYAFYNLPGIVNKFGKPGMAQNLILGARFAEDILPFRLGRMFNVGSFWSSFATPSNYSIALKHLATEGAITDVGRTYAGAMGLPEHEFLKAIHGEKLRGRSVLEHTRVSANSPFMRIRMDDLGEFDIRMFESTSRLGNTFGAMGSESFQMRELSAQQQARRASHILRDNIPLGEMGIGRRALRGLNNLFPNVVGAAVGRWSAIPTWDTNAFRRLQRSQDMAGDLLFVPGYGRSAHGAARAAKGLARDAIMSGYGAVRQSAAALGIKMSGARTVRGMAKSVTRTGALIVGGLWAASKLNNSVGGALTDPFFNVWERAMLARASFSDATGLTGLREQMPDVQTTAMLGILGAAAGIGLTYKYGVRVSALREEYGMASRMGDYGQSTWGIGESGFGIDVREESHKLAKARASAGMKKFFFRPELGDEWGDALSAKHYLKWSSLRGRGKVAVGIMGTLAALTAPFLIGSKYSREELGEIYAGNRNIEVKRGRWWELGSTPYEGGRTHYYRRHQIARRKLRAEQRVPGEGHTGLWGMIKSIRDPYWREKEAYYDRPFPVTGGTPLREIPLVGPLLDRVIGGFIKPQKYMHRDEWQSGEDYEQYAGGLAPDTSRGGLPSPTPRDPTGLAAQVREFTYRGTELMGLRGYLAQSIGSQKLFGGDMPFEQAAVMQPARLGPSVTDAFWEADLGGMAGLNEIYRRLIPRPERGTEVNPLRNQMPSWLPGNNYFINFKTGDPYSKVRYGAERMPGKGYEALNPEMAGVSPEDYSAFHRYKILADVAPWAAETRGARGAAYAEARNQPARLEALDRIDREVEQVKEKKNFKEYSFLAGRETVRGTVSRVGIGGEISLSDFPHHTFTMAGLNMGSSAVADQLRRHSSMTKDAATIRASQAASERQALLQDLMVGAKVTISIGRGGMNAPDVAGTFSINGRNINRMLVDRGLAGSEGGAPTAGPLAQLYGGAMEAIGHAPQKIPGPWMLMTKFFNQADPMEEYRRDVLYGSNNRFWDSPYENFIRPYMHQTISKLTPGEYIPEHVEEQREFDVVLDRTKFLKYAQGGELGKAGRTMAGGNMYGDPNQIQSALPHREKPFFEAFRQETDLRARERILSMVSNDMQRALVGQWTSQYAATQGKTAGQRNDIGAAVQMAQQQLHRLGRPVPPQGWAGSDPGIDWDDIKAVMVQNEGADTHDYNIWDDRTQSLLRKPYVYGAVEGLTSRRMQTNINSMSSDIGRNLGTQVMPYEAISHVPTVNFTMNNDVNYSTWENRRYKHHIDRVGEL